MSRAEDIARRFSLAGILDDNAQTRERFPGREVELGQIADHPSNVAYSMDEAGIAALAQSIKHEGLTDIPLVRKLADGTFQMISGHRRKAAYALLASTDPSFDKLPCRIVEDIDDDTAATLLHTANYFTRSLNVMERAEATRALGIEVERLRKSDPALKGERTADLKAAIIESQTGRAVSGKTVLRQEAVARKVEESLIEPWQHEARCGNLTDVDINRLAKIDSEKQAVLFAEKQDRALDRRATAELIQDAIGYDDVAEKALTQAQAGLTKALRLAYDNGAHINAEALGEIDSALSSLHRLVCQNQP